MNKTRAIIKYCVICVIVAIAVALCFVEFTFPFTNTKYVGCYQAIKNKMGIDLNGGVLAVYTVTPSENSTDLDNEVNATINRIKNTLSKQGYLESTVTRQGTNPNYKIRIEVPGMSNTEDIMDAIGTPANIEFMEPTADQSAAQTYDANKIFLTGEDLSGVKVVSDPENAANYAIQLSFTNEGKTKFREKVNDAGGQYLSIFSNKTLVSAPTISSDNASTLGSDGKVLVTGQYTKESADSFALQIESGMYTVGLDISQMSYIPATLGEGAIKAGLIALAIGMLIIFALMIIIYRDFGLLANLSLIIYTVIFVFFLAIIDSIQLTLPGIAGIILSIGMAVDAYILIFEQIKEEYRSGKNFAAATHAGFNKSIVTILDANVTTIIVSLILYLLSSGSIKGFAITLALGVGISMFVGLVITRALAKLYLYINPENAHRANIKSKPSDEAVIEVKPAVLQKRKLNMGGAK
ncbi:MAG: protein translocase subunit SecD [Eubacteriales bacterium]|nr:protein translocase subunit SecD [Eubacteriales bacterium]